MSPTCESELADIDPTCAISLLSAHGLEISFKAATDSTTALSIPLLNPLGSFLLQLTSYLL